MGSSSGLSGMMQGEDKDDEKTVVTPKRIVIIGGGISGLAAAYKLSREDLFEGERPQIILLERSSRAGGAISTYELEDYTLELGPDMFMTEKPEALKLCEDLGLSDYIVSTNESCRRTFIAQGGQLHPLPPGFQMLAPSQLAPFFSSPLMSMGGKLRMAMDLFIPKKSGDEDESLAQFVRRRFGQEALERIAQPMLGGVYTADPERLSLAATMPRFIEMEQKHSSVIRALMAEKKPGENGDAGCRYGKFVSLKRGLGMLTERLLSALPADCVHLQCPVTAIEKGTHGKTYDVVVASGTLVPADAVIISSPAFAAADILNGLDLDLADKLRKIQYSSCAVMNLIYNREDIPHALDGFGFVVPAVENRTILACSFASVKFPNRCPSEKAVLRIFAGGALQQDVFELSDEQIECLMWEDLHLYLGLKSVPLLSLITRYPRSMPQYHIGHIELVKEIRSKVQALPGIALAGNAYEGVGIPDCIRSGQKAAAELAAYFKSAVS
ncbi:MAG: protoporphyrinogen oxidase [Candidatus Obscuribacterales bacterium]|nr:protoporphyrinogen oxidase [Candidatus Obscuribacterales bacterium]